jgi:hypothetical protein
MLINHTQSIIDNFKNTRKIRTNGGFKIGFEKVPLKPILYSGTSWGISNFHLKNRLGLEISKPFTG